MNLNLIRPKNETEDLLLSFTRNCETFIKQTHRKTEETFEFKLTKPRETFSFKPSVKLALDSNWMIHLTKLEVYNSIFDITDENNTFKFCTQPLVTFRLPN